MAQVQGTPVRASTIAGSSGIDTRFLSSYADASSTTVTPGSVTFTVSVSTAGLSRGQWVLVDQYTANEEWVQLTNIDSSTTATATFKNSHSVSWTIKASLQRQVVCIGDPTTPGQLVLVNADGSISVAVIGDYATTSATTTVNASATSATLLTSNSGRKSISVFNSSSSATTYISEGIAAVIGAGGYSHVVRPRSELNIEKGIYRGAYNYISDTADGSYLNITERT